MTTETKPATDEEIEAHARLARTYGDSGVSLAAEELLALIARIENDRKRSPLQELTDLFVERDAYKDRAEKAEAVRNDLRRDLQRTHGDVRRARARADALAAQNLALREAVRKRDAVLDEFRAFARSGSRFAYPPGSLQKLATLPPFPLCKETER